MTGKDERAADMPGGIREAAPEEDPLSSLIPIDSKSFPHTITQGCIFL